MYRIGLDAVPLEKREGGIGYALFYFLQELIPQHPEWKFFLYTHTAESEVTYFKKYSNVIVRALPLYTFSHALWTQTSLAYAIYKDALDLFWASTQFLPLFRKKTLKTVLHLHDFAFKLYPKTLSPLKQLLHLLLTPYMIRSAHYLVAISQGSADKLFSLYNKRADLILPPPLKTSFCPEPKEKVDALLRPLGLAYKKYFLTIGTLEPRKNFIALIDTYLTLLKKKEKMHPLIIVGGGGWRNSALLRKLKHVQSFFPDQIKYLGRVADEPLSSLLSGARYYLCFSLYEGYGMPLAEARLCHTPVICFDQSELREATENDAFFLPTTGYEEKLEALLCDEQIHAPAPCLYSSNREKANSLARAFLNLLE